MPVTSEPFLIVGLGNPGSTYALHRHNVGFMALDEIAACFNVTEFKAKKSSLLAETRIDGARVFLLKPLLYMNCSGKPVRQCMDYYTIGLDNVLVIHDELDLPFGQMQLKKGGGSAGHNGIKDLKAHCGEDFWRIRFGIDHPGDSAHVSSYVLSNFSKPEINRVGSALDTLASHLTEWIINDTHSFQQSLKK
ncbi:MAG: aminoacyl-tRNA hydrolase [Alphaproteobacteria bacterium]|nr:MAG: aminoacyl-tRNA hydrolase [Alphaproteobacteria bacterium]